MIRSACLFLFALAALSADEDVVFKSDVSLVRVDAQVLDRNNRAITGLRMEDFVLRDAGRPQQIRNFASENMPVDVVLLLDVSASMRPHVERIASAAHEAMRVLGEKDRVAIMVFDRSTRMRLPFRNSREDVEREFERLLRQENFRGGTDINRGLLDAANYVRREGRRDARRAIVIVTDDQTERDRDEQSVSRALENANAVLSLLLAPDAMQNRSWPRGNRVPMGGPPTIGGALGEIIWGRRGPYGGQGPVMQGGGTQPAGTAEIARRSGGDSMSVDEASAFETTLARIRQRYALHFYLPDGEKSGREQNIDVALSDAARRRYPDAEVRFRRVNFASDDPPVVTRRSSSADDDSDSDRPIIRRRPAANDAPETASPAETSSNGGFRRVDGPVGQPGPIAGSGTSEKQEPRTGGWRKLKPGEKP